MYRRVLWLWGGPRKLVELSGCMGAVHMSCCEDWAVVEGFGLCLLKSHVVGTTVSKNYVLGLICVGILLDGVCTVRESFVRSNSAICCSTAEQPTCESH